MNGFYLFFEMPHLTAIDRRVSALGGHGFRKAAFRIEKGGEESGEDERGEGILLPVGTGC